MTLNRRSATAKSLEREVFWQQVGFQKFKFLNIRAELHSLCKTSLSQKKLPPPISRRACDGESQDDSTTLAQFFCEVGRFFSVTHLMICTMGTPILFSVERFWETVKKLRDGKISERIKQIFEKYL